MGKERVWEGCNDEDGHPTFEGGCEVHLDDEGFYVIAFCERHWSRGAPRAGDTNLVPRFTRSQFRCERCANYGVRGCPRHKRGPGA